MSLDPLGCTSKLLLLFALFGFLALHNFLNFVELSLLFASLIPFFLELIAFVFLFFKSILGHLKLLFVLLHVSVVGKKSINVGAVCLLEGTSEFEFIFSVLFFSLGKFLLKKSNPFVEFYFAGLVILFLLLGSDLSLLGIFELIRGLKRNFAILQLSKSIGFFSELSFVLLRLFQIFAVTLVLTLEGGLEIVNGHLEALELLSYGLHFFQRSAKLASPQLLKVAEHFEIV